MADPDSGGGYWRLCPSRRGSVQESILRDLCRSEARIGARRKGLRAPGQQGDRDPDRSAAVTPLAGQRTSNDLRAHRQLVVRESGTKRATRPSVEATQRWTVSHMATSIGAASMGYGFAWLPEEKIRAELAAGILKSLPLREGGE